MEFLDRIVEKRIKEAAERGDFDDLPGQGVPLKLDDDAMIPPELRMAYRILRNAGFVPPEVMALREISELERHIEVLSDNGERDHALRKLQLLRMKLEASGRFNAFNGAASVYSDRLLMRLGSGSPDASGNPEKSKNGADGGN